MPCLLRTVPIATLALVAVTACSRQRVPATPTPAPAVDAEHAHRDSPERAEAERRAAEERARAEREARLAELRRILEARIYFDLDRSDLSPAARETLDAKLVLLNRDPSLRLLVEGHADERGSDEYNLALGQRRAAAAKRYLTQRGISADRIETTSRGEERPVCTEGNESCWSQNRGDHFVITAGGEVASRR